ncbi:uncharacterized protein LOC113553948 [Rhopalosiphum maidis]|uniref:uncharacterized protein LOC113553948 n=1 Tax=Rhopalosiphum maidis TaxID=43146 RepID=UPI000EFEA2A4|nr:uncharacterized protein LOC113553948 [Rhopalosiphum maidis]
MKTSLVISIALFAFFTSEISCSDYCVEFNERCLENTDCCSGNCYFSGNPNNRYCMEPNSTAPEYKIENGTCLYKNSSYNKNASDTAYDTFGVHAAHAMLPPFTKIQLTYNNKTIDVTINGFTNKTNGTLLDLSREAADILGIKEGELVPCSLGVYGPEPNYSQIKKLIGLTASFFTVILVVMYIL